MKAKLQITISLGLITLLTLGVFLFIGLNSAVAETTSSSLNNLYNNDFESDTANQFPTGWVQDGTTADYTATTTRFWDGAQSLGARGNTVSLNHSYVFDGANCPAVGDYSAKIAVNFDDFAADRAGLAFRAKDDTTDTTYIYALRNGNSQRLASFSGTTETVLLDVATTTIATDTWYWLRAEVSGNSLRARMWINGQIEPTDWYASTTSATLGNTQTCVGVYTRIGDTNDVYFDYLEVDGEQQPLPTIGATTDADKQANIWFSMKQKYLRWDGAWVRPFTEGHTGPPNYNVDGQDVVSEGIAYALQFAVTNNDQTTFDLVEGFATSTLERTLDGRTAGSLMAFHYDVGEGNVVDDWNFASDADVDRLQALLWADSRWGSAGSVNYLAKANQIAGDLRDYSFRTYSATNILTSDSNQSSTSTPEINPSYIDTTTFKLYDQATSTTFWDEAVTGSYNTLEDHMDNAGTLATSAGFPSDWIRFDMATGDPIINFTRADSEHYGSEAFRVLFRLYKDYKFYTETRATTLLNTVGTFLGNYYANNSTIPDTFDHDGTNPAGYDLDYSTYAAYLSLLPSGTTTATTVYNAKLANIYTESLGGMGSSTATTTACYEGCGYYGDSWSYFGELLRTDVLQNFGQEVISAINSASAVIFFD